MSKKLVAYFSASGNTKEAAETIAKAAGADICEITPSSVESNNKSFRPEIIKNDIDMGQYDEVIIGFPIWWYVAPTIVNTFLEAYDFAGKKIVLFATSGGSGFGNTVKELQPSAPDAVITEGKLLNGMSKQEIVAWAESL